MKNEFTRDDYNLSAVETPTEVWMDSNEDYDTSQFDYEGVYDLEGGGAAAFEASYDNSSLASLGDPA